jgi:hypothetical protein
MGYDYKEQRPLLFTEEGMHLFLKVRDRVTKLLKEAGAVMLYPALSPVAGPDWHKLACLDYLVELNEIREIRQDRPVQQERIFVSAR